MTLTLHRFGIPDIRCLVVNLDTKRCTLRWLVLLLSLSVLSYDRNAFAESPLRGVRTARILIEDLDAYETKKCPIDAKIIQSEIGYVFASYSKLRILDSRNLDADAMIYGNLTILSIPTGALCMWNLEVQVVTFSNVTTTYDAKIFGKIILFSEAYMGVAPGAKMAAEVKKKLQEFVKQIISEHSQHN